MLVTLWSQRVKTRTETPNLFVRSLFLKLDKWYSSLGYKWPLDTRGLERDLVKHRLNFVLISDLFSLTFALQFEHKEVPGITVPTCPV